MDQRSRKGPARITEEKLMSSFLEKFREKTAIRMQDRYGNDQLNQTLTIGGLGCILLSGFVPVLGLLYPFGILMVGYSIFRMFSKNRAKREAELQKYSELSDKVRKWFRLQKNKWINRKTHLYCKCPSCKVTVRLRRNTPPEELTVTCPMCKQNFIKKV